MWANSVHAVGGSQRMTVGDYWSSPVVGLDVDSCRREHQVQLHVDQGTVNYRCKWVTTNCETNFF